MASVRPGCVAAFQSLVLEADGRAAGSDSDDGAVIVAEVRDASQPAASLASLAAAIRAAVMQHHALSLAAVVLVRPHCARKVSAL